VGSVDEEGQRAAGYVLNRMRGTDRYYTETKKRTWTKYRTW